MIGTLVFLVKEGKEIPYVSVAIVSDTTMLSISKRNGGCEVLARSVKFNGDIDERRLIWKKGSLYEDY